MTRQNWLERQMAAAEKDPQEQAIREMLRNIQEVKTPVKIISVQDVPEFCGSSASDCGVSAIIGQGRMASTEYLPIRTDNASACNIFIIKTPQEGMADKYTMVHIWSGDLDLNLPGHKREDIAAITNDKSIAIGITGGRSVGIIPTAREFKYEGITTTKHISASTGNRYVSVVYRPESNEILVRVGADVDATEVWVYEGF